MPTGRIAETLANECMVGKAFAWFFLHQLATLAAAELKKKYRNYTTADQKQNRNENLRNKCLVLYTFTS